MGLRIVITGIDGQVKAQAEGTDSVTLVYRSTYQDGDVIHMAGDAPGYVVAQLEDSMAETFGYLFGEFCLAVPFGEKRASYSPKSFTGDIHLLWVRWAQAQEVGAYRNLAFNPLDSHANSGHGPWPYQSWGINRDPEAELLLDFGREVTIDRLVFTLRADFPHDN